MRFQKTQGQSKKKTQSLILRFLSKPIIFNASPTISTIIRCLQDGCEKETKIMNYEVVYHQMELNGNRTLAPEYTRIFPVTYQMYSKWLSFAIRIVIKCM